MAEQAQGGGATKVGALYYEVSLDTAKLIEGQRQAGKSVDKLKTSLTDIAKAGQAHIDALRAEGIALEAEARAADAAAMAQARLGASTKKAAEAAQQHAVSAKQTAAALRGVPAQVTDIVTSLQGGQNPLTVFLQQGGQLRDMFGGALPAAKALGGYIRGLITPLTAGAAAAATFFLAFIKGEKEMESFNRTLQISGNLSGVTADQLNATAERMGKLSGITRGLAAESLSAFAEVGIRGEASLERFTTAAIRLEKAGGPAVVETAKAFKELEKAPTQAALKLNESTNFLTVSLYQQIKSLEAQGKTMQAARVAQNAYADAIMSRAPQVVANLGLMERGWLAVSSGAKKAWDALLDVGRTETPEQKLQATHQRIVALQKVIDQGGYTTPGGDRLGKPLTDQELAGKRAILEALKEQVRLSERAQLVAKEAADAEAERKKAVDAAASSEKREGARLAAQAYYEGLVADQKSALERINAEERRAQTENARRMSEDRANFEIYNQAKVAIQQKYARQRALLEEKNNQEVADLAIATTTDQMVKVEAIRNEEFRRAEAQQKLGVITAAQAERAKAMASYAAWQSYMDLAERNARANADAQIAITKSQEQSIFLVRDEAIRQAEQAYRRGAITFAEAEAQKTRAVQDAIEKQRALRSSRTNTVISTLQLKANGGSVDDQEALIRAQAAADLAAAEEARQRDLEASQIYADQKVAIEADMNRRIAEMRANANASALASTSDAFGALADVLRNSVGEQDSVYKAMFTAQKAFAIASAAVNIHKGISDAAAQGKTWQEKLVAIASVTAATASILSNIRSVNYGGGRQYGGPVSSDTLYRINETGRPEMFTAANGSQYLLPTADGNVTPANQVGAGRAGWTVIINNNAPQAQGSVTNINERTKTVEIAVSEVANQISSNSGQVWSAMRSATNVQGRL